MIDRCDLVVFVCSLDCVFSKLLQCCGEDSGTPSDQRQKPKRLSVATFSHAKLKAQPAPISFV